MNRRLPDEELRILIAVEEGRLVVDRKTGRYEINTEIPPERAARERLVAEKLIEPVWRLTPKGERALERELAKRVAETQAREAARS